MTKKKPYLADVGRLIYDLAAMRKRPLSFSNCHGMSAAAWNRKAHKAFLDGLGCPFERVNLDMRLEETVERDGYTEERITFASTSLHRISALVLVPHAGKPPFPAVVALHDHGGFYLFGKEKIVERPRECRQLRQFKMDAYEGRSWASEIARRGYLVVAIDALGWGDRNFCRSDVRNPVQAPDYHAEMVEQTHERNEPSVKQSFHADLHAAWAGTSWAGIVNWDDRRTVDYLLSRKDVDRKKIVCLGLSGGGFRSTYLFGSDPRIAAAGIVGWMTCLAEQLLFPTDTHLGMFSAPGVSRLMDHPDVAALGAPRNLFLMQCARDQIFPHDAMKRAAELIADIYDSWGRPENFRRHFYDVPHCFNIKMQTDMFEWFDLVLDRA